jgi:transposase-like protein
MPEKITVDAYAVTQSAIAELKRTAVLPINRIVRPSKDLNHLIEQDHRRVKQRVYPMLGFKRFGDAIVTISGIELAHKIKKGQFNTSELRLEGARAQELWQAVLAA